MRGVVPGAQPGHAELSGPCLAWARTSWLQGTAAAPAETGGETGGGSLQLPAAKRGFGLLLPPWDGACLALRVQGVKPAVLARLPGLARVGPGGPGALLRQRLLNQLNQNGPILCLGVQTRRGPSGGALAPCFSGAAPSLCRGGTQLVTLLRAPARQGFSPRSRCHRGLRQGPRPFQSRFRWRRLQQLLAAQGQAGDIPVPPCCALQSLAPTPTKGVLLSLLSLLVVLLCPSWAGSSSVTCLRVTRSVSLPQLSPSFGA